MIRSTILLASLAAAGTAAAQTVAPMTAERLWQLPPDRIGDMLLPPDHPAIAHVRFGSPGPPSSAIDFVLLFTAARPLGADFCVQDSIEARITPIPHDPKAVLDALPKPVGAPQHIPQYRYRPAGEDCDGAKTFFTIDGMPRDRGLAAFRLVRDAIALAKRGPHQRLPFVATYDDGFLPRMAGDTAADVLAEADPGTALQITAPPAGSLRDYGPVARLAAAKGWQFFQVELGEIGGNLSTTISVAVVEGRIARLAIERSYVVY